ncbi:glycosyl hydrolase family 85-domain-containing protein [Lipomyces tetrasporus]|uniref:Glycosyl hydrolase family 85-domain-containing protein n=1 Tax=Lipomyces tetrasporus TaxID=54092 RepID=A0AAD7VR44_9ASCO|nr:glycosyl hydrolase family 85-domain-containing protein [Lipomyces tetrasporus]KAJ8098244.1 glycosyl hydrolase family 85-domain-containing protein [Lipomyces tetrasporus]
MTTSCLYFSSLKALQDWHESQDDLQISRAPLRRRHRYPNRIFSPRLLVCHDFKGGYSPDEDDLFQGYFPHRTGTAYWARAFAMIDTFVYFSHKRVALPPVSWTNACHKSGVRCLGTIIFEHKSSVSDARLLLTPNAAGTGYLYADIFARLARHYGFDGYLLNMETTMGSPAKARELLNFVEYLKFCLHKVVGPEARVIWYDSLTIEDKIDYQDALNMKTLPFFRAADGLFTNYFWEDRQVYEGAKLAGMLFRLDLWTGLDVWGRKVHYPAKWEIGKALRRIEASGTSLALFAPAWVYEELGAKDFEVNDFSFWYDNVENETKRNISVSEFIRPHPAPVLQTEKYQMFYTSFNTGHGQNFFVNGKAEYLEPWVNHGLQTALPTYPHTSHSPYLESYSKRLLEQRISTALPGTFKTSWKIDYTRAFYGGSSLKFTSDPYNHSPYLEAIFSSSPPQQSSSSRTSQSPSRSPVRSKNGSLRRMTSSSQLRPPRIFVTPLFLLDFVLQPSTAFIFFVTFMKYSKGDVKIRLSGRWLVESPRTQGTTCYDEVDSDTPHDIYADGPAFEADLSGSVLNSWVRKSFSFRVPGLPSIGSQSGRSRPEPREATQAEIQKGQDDKFLFQINHLDIECGENFSGSIYLGSILLFSKHADSAVHDDGVVTAPSVTAPARVTNVCAGSYEMAKALRWDEDEETTEWIVYVNGRMVGVACAPGWVLSAEVTNDAKDEITEPFDSVTITSAAALSDQTKVDNSETAAVSLRVRIDAVGCGGTIVKGVEQIVRFQ